MLIPLGINGFFPGYGRQTACYLFLPDARTAILLDAGTGLARLGEPEIAAKLGACPELHILVSHYHLDHVSGLFYLPGVWRGKRAVIYAPSAPLVATAGQEAVVRLLSPPYFPLALKDLPLEVVAVTATEVTIAGLKVRFRSQQHPGGSVGIRIDDRLCYVTDTPPDPETVAFARDCRLLLHEVWFTDAEVAALGGPEGAPAKSGHSWVSAVAALAARAAVGTLLPVHIAPWRCPDEVASLVEALREQAGLPVMSPEEGKEIILT